MYRELVSRYIRPAIAVAWEFTDTIEDAEDLVQEAFRRVVQALPRFDVSRPFAPWFFTILRNVARNTVQARGLRVHVALSDGVPDEAPTTEELVDYLELEARVAMHLDSLPDMQRTCFRLCVLEGLSSQEVAAALGVSDRTVRTHVHRARRSLQQAVLPFVEEEQR
ncbi:MAG TPA: sigma-70 family RNA polymerase sigma factor [Gemmatimonadales bacterium]|nr:sigma-70 family RNA polymerase sigma factor [Gemmatimonadales bacterium]